MLSVENKPLKTLTTDRNPDTYRFWLKVLQNQGYILFTASQVPLPK